MEEEICLLDILKILYKNIGILIASVILGGILSFCYCFFAIEEQYQSTAKLLLTKSKDEYDYNNSLVLIKTVSELPKQSIILDKVAEEYHLQVEELMHAISVANPQSSLVIEITCTTNDKSQSRLLANAVVDTLIEECSTNEELIMIGDSLFKTSTAQVGTPVKNNRFLIGIAIVFFSFLFGIILCFIRFSFQNKKEKKLRATETILKTE